MHTGILETALQTENTIAAQFAESRLAGREHRQVTLAQVHRGDVCCRDDAAIVKVGTGKSQQTVLHRLGIGRLLHAAISTMRGDMQQVYLLTSQFHECRLAGI